MKSSNEIKTEVGSFNFENWNLIEVKRAISEIWENPLLYPFTESQLNFLLTINKKIDEINQNAIKLQHIQLMNDSRSTTDIIKLKNEYKDIIEKCYKEIHAAVSDLSYSVELQLKLYMNTKNVPEKKNTFIVTLQNFFSTPGFQIDLYRSFLENMIICCLGITNTIAYNLKTMEPNLSVMFRPLIFADELGATVFPESQSMDPMMGMWFDKQQGNKYAINKGICSGKVYVWSERISKDGLSSHPIILDTTSFYEQQKFHQSLHHSRSANIKAVFSDKFDIVPKIGDRNIFILDLTIPDKDGGHSLGIRRIPHTNEIEFYDPNFGLFIFQNNESFAPFFKLLLTIYRQANLPFENIAMGSAGIQPENAKTSIPFVERKNSGLSYNSCKLVVEQFKQFYDSKRKKMIDQENKLNSLKVTCSDYFLNILPSLITNLNAHELTELQNLIKKELKFLSSPLPKFYNSTQMADKKVTDLFSERLAHVEAVSYKKQ